MIAALASALARAADLPLYCQLDPANNPPGEFISVTISESSFRVRMSSELEAHNDSLIVRIERVDTKADGTRVFSSKDERVFLSALLFSIASESIPAVIAGNFVDPRTKEEISFSR